MRYPKVVINKKEKFNIDTLIFILSIIIIISIIILFDFFKNLCTKTSCILQRKDIFILKPPVRMTPNDALQTVNVSIRIARSAAGFHNLLLFLILCPTIYFCK